MLQIKSTSKCKFMNLIMNKWTKIIHSSHRSRKHQITYLKNLISLMVILKTSMKDSKHSFKNKQRRERNKDKNTLKRLNAHSSLKSMWHLILSWSQILREVLKLKMKDIIDSTKKTWNARKLSKKWLKRKSTHNTHLNLR